MAEIPAEKSSDDSDSKNDGLFNIDRRNVMKAAGASAGAMAVGGSLLGSATAETADGNCVQVDFVTGTTAISDLSSSTYSGSGRLVAYQWGEMVDNDTGGESGDRTPVSDTCSINVSSGDPTINFSTEKATVDYTLGSCGGDQDLLLVSYESPCNGAASTGGQFDPANADQQTVFDTATATTQSDGSLTVDVPPLPSGVPERGNAEAYIPLDTSAATNCRTGADATVFGSPSSGANGVSSNTNDAFSFDGSDDALQAGQNLPLNGPQATVAAWFKSPSFSTFEALFSINGGPNSTPKDNGGGYTVSFDGNEIRPTIWTSSSANFGGNKIALSTGTWYFAVAVADGNSCTLYVYDQTGELSSSPVSVDDSSGNGRTQTGDASLTTMVENGNWLPGNLDEVYGFSTALTTSEIDTLYNNSF